MNLNYLFFLEIFSWITLINVCLIILFFDKINNVYFGILTVFNSCHFLPDTFKLMHFYLILLSFFFSTTYHLNSLFHFQLSGFIYLFFQALEYTLLSKTVLFFAFPFSLNFLSSVSLLEGLFISYIPLNFILYSY